MNNEPGKNTINVTIPDDTDFNNYRANGTAPKLSDYEQYRITESTPIKVPINIITLNNESAAGIEITKG